MTVMILESVPARLRGELSRWLLEPRTGVFVGEISALVREKLWEMACKGMQGGGGILIHSAATEQGFVMHVAGETRRSIVDVEGLQLVRIRRE